MKMRSPSAQLPYNEGTWFAVPLRQGGYAIGRVARLATQGKIFVAYFFGPKRERVPTLHEIDHLDPHDAIKVIHVGDLGLIDGSWQILGDSQNWQRDRWPMPACIRRDPLSLTAWRVSYSDNDPNIVISEQRIPYETTGLETAGFCGSGAVEYVLTKILDA